MDFERVLNLRQSTRRFKEGQITVEQLEENVTSHSAISVNYVK